MFTQVDVYHNVGILENSCLFSGVPVFRGLIFWGPYWELLLWQLARRLSKRMDRMQPSHTRLALILGFLGFDKHYIYM